MTIVHNNSQELCKIASRITEDLEEVNGNPKLRIALDFGKIKYSLNNNNKVSSVITGSPLRIAARVEPNVTPGEVWVTESFKKVLDDEKGSFFAEEIDPDKFPDMPQKSGCFNVKKEGGTEEEILLKLYRIIKRE